MEAVILFYVRSTVCPLAKCESIHELSACHLLGFKKKTVLNTKHLWILWNLYKSLDCIQVSIVIPNDNLDLAHFSSLCNHQWLSKGSRKRGSQPRKLGQDSLAQNLSPPAKKLLTLLPKLKLRCIHMYLFICIYIYIYILHIIYIHMFYLKTSHASSAVYMQDSHFCAACRNSWECTFNWIDFTIWIHRRIFFGPTKTCLRLILHLAYVRSSQQLSATELQCWSLRARQWLPKSAYPSSPSPS